MGDEALHLDINTSSGFLSPQKMVKHFRYFLVSLWPCITSELLLLCFKSPIEIKLENAFFVCLGLVTHLVCLGICQDFYINKSCAPWSAILCNLLNIFTPMEMYLMVWKKFPHFEFSLTIKIWCENYIIALLIGGSMWECLPDFNVMHLGKKRCTHITRVVRRAHFVNNILFFSSLSLSKPQKNTVTPD